MKFDYVIGNPPYQDTTIGDNDTFAPPVYDRFMDAAYNVGEKVELIHPARFLFNAGSTPKSWNDKMLHDEHFKILNCESNSKSVFPNTDIKGGIAISYHDATRRFGAIDVFTPFAELRSIKNKAMGDVSDSVSDITYSRTSQKLSKKLHEENSWAISRLSKGHDYDMSSNIFNLLPELFTDDIPEDNREYVQILGRENNERTYKYLRKDYTNDPEYFSKYKVFVAGANGCGAIGETLSTPLIGNTESFIAIGAFNTQLEAENCMSYIKTKFARALLGILKVTQAITPEKWKYVPLQDFTSDSDIDWSQSISDIDQQLYKKYGLTNEEIDFIETHVKEMN